MKVRSAPKLVIATTEPFEPCVTEVIVAVEPSSTSESLLKTLIVVAVASSAIEVESAAATGPSLVPVIVIVTVSVAVAFVIVMLTPELSATAQILARTKPTLIDLGVGLAAGAAAAYGVSRKSVAALWALWQTPERTPSTWESIFRG